MIPGNRMRRLLPLLAALLATPVLAVAQEDPAAFRVMSFNIRYNNPGDSLNAWPHRAEGVMRLLRYHDPDLVGLQEAQRGQLSDFERLLPGYAWVGLPRDDGRPSDEYSAILYRTDRFELLESGTFWLSETPTVPRSRGWDAALPRIATWGRFRDRATGDTVLHVNTHFDHMGVRARAESGRLLKRWLGENAGSLPVLLTGDFNTTPGSEPIAALLDPAVAPRLVDALEVAAEPPYGPASTWNGFRAIEPERRIDFVFVGPGVRVLEHATLAETLVGVHFPSDHLPVIAEVELAGPGGAAGGAAVEEVRAVVRRLFDGMRAGDSTAVRSAFHPEARLQTTAVANGEPVVRTDAVSDFVRAVGTPHAEVWDERISGLEIQVDEPLATAWMRYRFHLGDRFSHCGVNAMQLLRTSAGWRIFQLVDTRRASCPE